MILLLFVKQYHVQEFDCSSEKHSMLQVLIECPDRWSDNGSLRLDGNFSSEVSIRPEVAQKTANAYLGLDVGMAFRSGKPVLVLGDSAPVWRMPIELHWYGIGKLASFGELDVDATTDKVIQLDAETIRTLQDRANVLLKYSSPSAAP